MDNKNLQLNVFFFALFTSGVAVSNDVLQSVGTNSLKVQEVEEINGEVTLEVEYSKDGIESFGSDMIAYSITTKNYVKRINKKSRIYGVFNDADEILKIDVHDNSTNIEFHFVESQNEKEENVLVIYKFRSEGERYTYLGVYNLKGDLISYHILEGRFIGESVSISSSKDKISFMLNGVVYAFQAKDLEELVKIEQVVNSQYDRFTSVNSKNLIYVVNYKAYKYSFETKTNNVIEPCTKGGRVFYAAESLDLGIEIFYRINGGLCLRSENNNLIIQNPNISINGEYLLLNDYLVLIESEKIILINIKTGKYLDTYIITEDVRDFYGSNTGRIWMRQGYGVDLKNHQIVKFNNLEGTHIIKLNFNSKTKH